MFLEEVVSRVDLQLGLGSSLQTSDFEFTNKLYSKIRIPEVFSRSIIITYYKPIYVNS